jgi:hypothetical protein
MSPVAHAPPRVEPARTYALWALLAAFAFQALQTLKLGAVQAPGADYSCFWAGVKALADGRLYDFAHVTALQGWPFGPGAMRPYVYPPSALLVFSPFAALPYWIGYGAWVAASFALMAWASRRLGAPWWMALFPVAWLVGFCGQVTFLIGGLVAAALTLRHRPILAGVLLGLAAAVKPQMLILMPLALVATRQWRTLFAAGATGAVLCLTAAAIWGVGYWGQWLQALSRFHAEVILPNPGLVDDGITPYAVLTAHGLPGAWAFLLAPLAAALVWVAFRKTESAPDRLIVLFAATLMISPYAMNYEAALLLPAVAAYLARTEDRLWPLYATVACIYTVALAYGFASVAAALVLPLSTWLRNSDAVAAYARRITAKSASS